MTRHSTAFWVLLGAPFLLLTNGCSSDFSDCNELRACPNAGAAGIAGAAGSTGSANFAGQSGTSDGSAATSAAQAGAAGGSAVQSGVDEAGAAGESNAVGGEGGAAGAAGVGAGEGGSSGNSANAGGAGSGGNTPPAVVSITPANKAVSVDPNVQPALNFSETLDRSTVTSSSIKLLSGTAAVPGAVTFSGTSALFSPSSPLDLLGTYTVFATTDLKDAGGANLLTPFSSSFTVRDGVWGVTKDLGAISAADHPVVGEDEAGNSLFVWANSPGAAIFARWYRGGGWGELIQLSDRTTHVSQPLVAVNAKGDALVAFTDEFTLYTRQYRNGAWNLPSPALDASCEPSVGMSPAGVAYVVCNGPTALIARRTDTRGDWVSNPTALVTGGFFSTVSFTFSSNDEAIATWSYSDSVGLASRPITQTARFMSSGWSAVTTIPGSQSEIGVDAASPAIASDMSGNIMVAWLHWSATTMGVLASRQSQSGEWSTPTELSNETGTASIVPNPRLALVSDGKDFILAWNQMNGAQWTTYQARNVAGVWQEATTPQAHRAVVPSGDQMPSLGVDSRGNLVILWVEAGPTNADRYIEASRYVRATSTWSPLARLNTFANTTTAAALAVSASGRAAVVYANNGVGEFYANIFE